MPNSVTLHHRSFIYEKNLSSDVTRGENIGVAALVTTPGNDAYLQAVYTEISPLLANFQHFVSSHHLIDDKLP